MFHIMRITEVGNIRGHLRLRIPRKSLLESYEHIRSRLVITPNRMPSI
jgi:hypothetical protein